MEIGPIRNQNLIFWPLSQTNNQIYGLPIIQLGVFDTKSLGWRQDNGNRTNQESKFDFLATRQQLGKIERGQQKIKIVRTTQQSNLRGSCQSIFSLCRHHPNK